MADLGVGLFFFRHSAAAAVGPLHRSGFTWKQSMRKYVHVQPAVAAIVAELGDDTISVAEVAKRVYRLRWVEKKHKVAVLRVLHASPDVGSSLARRCITGRAMPATAWRGES
jgi:hypothetical protein